jgi:hypothetical protein
MPLRSNQFEGPRNHQETNFHLTDNVYRSTHYALLSLYLHQSQHQGELIGSCHCNLRKPAQQLDFANHSTVIRLDQENSSCSLDSFEGGAGCQAKNSQVIFP